MVWLAVLSGILTALAFPKFSFSFLAWISLVPLFFVLAKSRGKSAFWFSTLAGLFYYGILLYWIPDVPAHYGGMPYWLCLVVYFALIGFLSLYWGLFGFFFSKIRTSFPDFVFFLAPFLWVGSEYVMTHFLSGFPWGILGTSQYKNVYLIQTASLAGVFGVSFLLVLLQSTFVLAMTRSKKKGPFFAALSLLVLAHAWGFFLVKKDLPENGPEIRAAVIQGNVSSDIYWDRISSEEIWTLFEDHMKLTERGVRGGARLVIWPEFTVPLCFSCEEEIYGLFKSELEKYVQQTGTTLLFGTNETTGPPDNRMYHNTAMCLHPDMRRTLYFKMHLVPFGEYTPYKKIFFFIETLTHAIGDITPGEQYVLHDFQGYKFASPICYEIIFPGLVRTFVWDGAHFLVTITNDGWYGETSAPHQHWAQAVFRAVENRRFLLRAATTGISGIVDPYGRIRSHSDLNTKAVLTENINPSSRLSFYTQVGDILPIVGLTLGGLFFILAMFNNRKGRRKYGQDRDLI